MRAFVLSVFWLVMSILFATGVFRIDVETAPKILAVAICVAASMLATVAGDKR